MHGFYLYYRDVEDASRAQTGIDQKVAEQIAELNRVGLNCEFVLCPQPESLPGMVASCLPLFRDGIHWPSPCSLEGADYVHIRQPRFISRELVAFLRELRELSPDTLIILEFPNYPYDGQMLDYRQICALMKDRHWRKRLTGLVDYAGDLTGASTIFGLPTVQLTNGINLERVGPRNPQPVGERIDIMYVAFFMPCHGADLALRGLREYYDKASDPRDICLHICGGGSSLPSLKRLSKRLSLDEYVVYHGVLSPDELAPLYDKCSLAFECLAMHRKHDEGVVSASLKSREYLARGIPFVCSSKIDFLLAEPADFVLELPSGEHPVDFEHVVRFHDDLYARIDPKDLVREMREYAGRHVSSSAAMCEVVSLIKSHCD